MSNIEISVIVTVYNIEQYIGECLDSILQQKDSNFEIICVDDASTVWKMKETSGSFLSIPWRQPDSRQKGLRQEWSLTQR